MRVRGRRGRSTRAPYTFKYWRVGLFRVSSGQPMGRGVIYQVSVVVRVRTVGPMDAGVAVAAAVSFLWRSGSSPGPRAGLQARRTLTLCCKAA